MDKIKARLRGKLNNKGLSMVELLCATLILLLVSGIMVMGIGFAYREYDKSMRESESKVLCSTITTVINHELAYTMTIYTDQSGNVKKFQSPSFAMEDSPGMIMTDAKRKGDYGHIIIGNPEDVDESMAILGKSAYTYGLLAKVKSLTYDNATHIFTVELALGYKGEEYLSTRFQVKNVNEIDAQLTTGN